MGVHGELYAMHFDWEIEAYSLQEMLVLDMRSALNERASDSEGLYFPDSYRGSSIDTTSILGPLDAKTRYL